MELLYLSACGYGLIAGTIFANRDTLISLLSVFWQNLKKCKVIVLPLLLLSGFFVKITSGQHFLWILHYLNPCKYGFSIGIKVFLVQSV